MSDANGQPYANGAAYVDGQYHPIGEAKISILDWGYRRSDVTYDVVGVWNGAFFRLDDHIRRFRASMNQLQLSPPESEEEIKQVLTKLIRLSGLRHSYVGMDCVRGTPPAGAPRHPKFARNYLVCHAVPWIWIAPKEKIDAGLSLYIASPRRIPPESFEPRVKNFHWGDLTRGQFQALEAGADFAVLLDGEGNVTEGAGFNVFCVRDGVVITPSRGALDGITRMSVMELCEELGLPLQVRPVPADEFRDADEIFGCTTAGGIMPVTRIDGRILGNGSPGPVSSLIKELFWKKRAEGWLATPIDYDSPL